MTSTVRLKAGTQVELDGELLTLIEALYREVSLRSELRGSFEDMMKEIRSVVSQMSAADQKRYLIESLFLNFVTYENEMLDAYMRKLTGGGRKKVKGAKA